MSEWVEVAKRDEVAPGSMSKTRPGEKGIQVKGEEILLSNIDGQFYAIGGRCGHMSTPLARGSLEGRVVTCAAHGAKFDITSGAVVSRHRPEIDRMLRANSLPLIPTRPVPSYQVRIEGDSVQALL